MIQGLTNVSVTNIMNLLGLLLVKQARPKELRFLYGFVFFNRGEASRHCIKSEKFLTIT